MYVIADVEWVETHSHRRSPTQLAAVRVDENWEIVEEFFSYIRPMNSSFYDWDNIAYNGGTPSDFKRAPQCYDVFKTFNEWCGDDVICWWHTPSAHMHAFVNKVVLSTENTKQPIILSEYMPGFLKGEGACRGSAYKIARARNIAVPSTEHNSWNDLIAILRLFKGIAFPQSALSAPPVNPEPKVNKPSENTLEFQYDTNTGLIHKKGCDLIPENAAVLGYGTLNVAMKKKYKACSCVRAELRQAKRERVIDEIKRSQYTFVHTEYSNVFHRYDCGLIHNAEHILGAVKYATVANKGLRPCRVCNPKPNDQYRSVVYETKIKAMMTPKLAKHSLKKTELVAVTRFTQARKERDIAIKKEDMSEQQRADMYTLTQPQFAFFVARGYQNFHTRNCTRLAGLSGIRGFGTCAHAKNAGYTPCKQCKPTNRQDVVVSIPFCNKVRDDETIDELHRWCEMYGYEHELREAEFCVKTPVGKWKIHTDLRPVTVEHINLFQNPCRDTYHKQHRIFLSMLDALKYINRHDKAILKIQHTNY